MTIRAFPILALTFTLAATSQTTPTPTPTETHIIDELKGLRAVPDTDRGYQTGKIAREIRSLPTDSLKLQLAVGLSHLATEGDPGHDNLQEVTTTLSLALIETPVAPDSDGNPAEPYTEIASLVRYEGMKTTLTDPQLAKATALLAANDAAIEKADFTLPDLAGKKWALSQLRGKIVLVNFWATWCPPCRKEMPDLNAFAAQYKSQGLVILSISDEDAAKVSAFITKSGYTYPILLDPGRKVHDQFHIEGIPKSFVFSREGKLITESIDMRTKGQFLAMLVKAGIKP